VTALCWQWHQGHKQAQGGGAAHGSNAAVAQAISGVWQGKVTYSWGPSYTERFLFEAEGDTLFSTASFLAFKRGIEDGRIEGNKISFTVRFQETLEGMGTEHKNRYTGTLSGDQIRFRVQDDKGNPPIEFVVTKEGQAG
jgi:hypothetical protein